MRTLANIGETKQMIGELATSRAELFRFGKDLCAYFSHAAGPSSVLSRFVGIPAYQSRQPQKKVWTQIFDDEEKRKEFIRYQDELGA